MESYLSISCMFECFGFAQVMILITILVVQVSGDWNVFKVTVKDSDR